METSEPRVTVSRPDVWAYEVNCSACGLVIKEMTRRHADEQAAAHRAEHQDAPAGSGR